MTATERFIAAALDCVDTPFQDHGRDVGKGLDCVGVVIHAAAAAGIAIADRPYVIAQGVDLWPSMSGLAAHYFDAGEMPLQAGDLVLMKMRSWPRAHVAIYVGGNRIVQSLNGRGVGLMGLDHSVVSKIVSVWRVPE